MSDNHHHNHHHQLQCSAESRTKQKLFYLSASWLVCWVGCLFRFFCRDGPLQGNVICMNTDTPQLYLVVVNTNSCMQIKTPTANVLLIF